MAWPGYFEFNGNEIVNVPRTAAYARARGAYWAVESYSSRVDLARLLGTLPYTTPDAGDPAPWYAPNAPESLDFLGVIPGENGINGIEASTRTATTSEFTTDGGFTSPTRESTKAVVFDLYLLATSEAGVNYGFEWLKAATNLRDCHGRRPGMLGADLRFANSIPEYDSASGQSPAQYWSAISRRLRHVKPTDGPAPTSKTIRRREGCSVIFWRVTMTLTADDPVIYGSLVPVIDNLGGSGDPYVPGVTGDYQNTPVVHTDTSCATPVYTPVFDPNCPPLVTPPEPPDIDPACAPTPSQWQRRWVEIPADLVPKFGEAIPTVKITAGGEDLRSVRLRWFDAEDFYDDPTCGHFAVQLATYVPANSSLWIDGVAKASYVNQGGVVRRSDSLTLGQYKKPIQWFGLSCAQSYIVAMDVPAGQPSTTIEISLTGRSG